MSSERAKPWRRGPVDAWVAFLFTSGSLTALIFTIGWSFAVFGALVVLALAVCFRPRALPAAPAVLLAAPLGLLSWLSALLALVLLVLAPILASVISALIRWLIGEWRLEATGSGREALIRLARPWFRRVVVVAVIGAALGVGGWPSAD